MTWTFLVDVGRHTLACDEVVGDAVEEGSNEHACEVEGLHNDHMVGEGNLDLGARTLESAVSGEEMTMLLMEAVLQQQLSCFQCVAASQGACGGSTNVDHDVDSDATCSPAVEDEDCLVSSVSCHRLK